MILKRDAGFVDFIAECETTRNDMLNDANLYGWNFTEKSNTYGLLNERIFVSTRFAKIVRFNEEDRTIFWDCISLNLVDEINEIRKTL